MTEGPTARLRSIQIKKRYLNSRIVDIWAKSKRIYVDLEKLIGRRLVDSTTYGKNILMDLRPYGIRIHLMMYGSIRFEEDPSKPKSRLRLRLDFDKGGFFVYNAPIVEIDLMDRIEERLSRELGFDPFREWNEDELIDILIGNGDRIVGEILLDQSIFAGIGNILRNEILFRAGIRPDRKISSIPLNDLRNLVRITRELSFEFLENKVRGKGIRDLLMVYNAKVCKKCGGKIVFYRDKITGRKTFYCPNCQV